MGEQIGSGGIGAELNRSSFAWRLTRRHRLGLKPEHPLQVEGETRPESFTSHFVQSAGRPARPRNTTTKIRSGRCTAAIMTSTPRRRSTS